MKIKQILSASFFIFISIFFVWNYLWIDKANAIDTVSWYGSSACTISATSISTICVASGTVTCSPDCPTKCGLPASTISTCVNSCGVATTKSCAATASCTSFNLSMTKKVYRDEATNVAGNYKYTNKIDTVSKSQTVVMALEVINKGLATASGITVKDVLKENNRELLTFVDSDSRCSYNTSSRTVSCSGMSLNPGKSDVYAFRVKVSDGAVNGETILNDASLNFTDKPTNVDINAKVELLISTVVGCDNTCTTDEECGDGLACDPDTNKCRKPACAESMTCVCSSTGNRENSGTGTNTSTSEPDSNEVLNNETTTLPETGILDFPGVAAFGGGLLIAIVGILLAL